MNNLSAQISSKRGPKQNNDASYSFVRDAIGKTLGQEPIRDIRNNAGVLQNRKLTYLHTEKIWTHNGYDKSANYTREMDI